MRRLRLLGSLVRRHMPAGSHGLVRRIGIEKARTCLIAFAGRVDRGRSHGRSGQCDRNSGKISYRCVVVRQHYAGKLLAQAEVFRRPSHFVGLLKSQILIEEVSKFGVKREDDRAHFLKGATFVQGQDQILG